MGKSKTPGLYLRGKFWHIDMQYRGRRICESSRTSDAEEALTLLEKRKEAIRKADLHGERPRRSFRSAATRYLKETRKRTLTEDARHLKKLDRFIGDLPLDAVNMATLGEFIESRKHDGVSPRTINLSLHCVRRILNLAADEWVDASGLTWLERAPIIRMLENDDPRKPYPLDWEEQRRLFRRLPAHLEKMALFKVNSGCRDKEVCSLLWAWESKIPGLGTSVFVVPRAYVKNNEDRLVVLNKVAQSILESCRGEHPEYVFPIKGRCMTTMNNSAWQRARIEATVDAIQEETDCLGLDIAVEGRRQEARVVIRYERQDMVPVSFGYTFDDYVSERRKSRVDEVDPEKLMGLRNLRHTMRLRAIRRFIDMHRPEYSAVTRVRVHDLKHTYGRRLRAAGVGFEDRQDLLGHKSQRGITTHYSEPELANLIEATNRVCTDDPRKNPALVILRSSRG